MAQLPPKVHTAVKINHHYESPVIHTYLMHQNLLVSSVVYFQKRKLNFVMNWTQIIKKLRKLLREKTKKEIYFFG